MAHLPLTINAFSKERFHPTLTAAIAGHLVCQHPHRLASCYMRFHVDVGLRCLTKHRLPKASLLGSLTCICQLTSAFD